MYNEENEGGNKIMEEDISSIVCEIEQPRPRNNKSTLQFNRDTYYTLYTETKFNKLQKWLWKKLLNIKIEDWEE